MINTPTVLVLGAGASYPYGFPTGGGLKDKITQHVLKNGPRPRLLLPEFHGRPTEEFRTALLRSGRSSVDMFLEGRPDLMDIGKAAIANALLPCETTSGLFDVWARIRHGDISKEKHSEVRAAQVPGNWYEFLFNKMTESVPYESIQENKLSIVTFNYDRSIEHYLLTALKNTYNKTSEEIGSLLSHFEIIHVHGSLGKLPWQAGQKDGEVVNYGGETVENDVRLAAKSIKILHEGKTDSKEFTRARTLIKMAKRTHFLGFGFHSTNLQRLGLSELSHGQFTGGGTCMGLSRDTKEKVLRVACLGNEFEKRFFPTTTYEYLHEQVVFD